MTETNLKSRARQYRDFMAALGEGKSTPEELIYLMGARLEDGGDFADVATFNFNCSWNVPAKPEATRAATFIWPGLHTGDILLQPVLDWDGRQWSISCWAVNGETIRSKVVQVEVGDTIMASIRRSSGTWFQTITSSSGGISELSHADAGKTWAVGIVYELSNKPTGCDELPYGVIEWRDIQLSIAGQPYNKGNWVPFANGNLQCGQGMQMNFDCSGAKMSLRKPK